MRFSLKTGLVSAVLTLFFVSSLALAGQTTFPGQKQYSAEAKITLQQAEKMALKAFPGTIIAKELEKEKGGSGLRYSFDIRHGKVVHEVGIDAKTGKLLENSDEASDSD